MKRLIALSAVLPLIIAATATAASTDQSAKVQRVVDGDTIQVKIGTKTEKIRIIGIDTPETVDPRTTVQCFGKEASNKMKRLLARKAVTLVMNPAEDRDKYQRLLRYVELKGKDIGAQLISEGYAFSYKQYPHPRLEEYNLLEKGAMEHQRGLWASCEGKKAPVKQQSSSSSAQASSKATCTIKGNVSTSKEKIYHLSTCRDYNRTVIDTSKGEQWFCTEQEAVKAGWRKAGNC
ncbi:thermonuclease family protein [Candidatus Peribacteria bacterium]|nr:MAG: thermonuclease family protein [Candidatus Peribacteria bacterium]